jgi:transcriptional regulator GlxA family with amidase domain
MLACGLKDWTTVDKRSMTDPRIAQAVTLMHRRLEQPLGIAALAADVNLSYSRFRQLFTVQTGVTPGRYLQGLRLRCARLLIERTFLTIKEVMTLVGYKDPSHFSKDFKRYYGMPPSALRGTEAATPLPLRHPVRARIERAELSERPTWDGSAERGGRRRSAPGGQRRIR